MSSPENISIALVGGGIGGLCLAAGLLQQPNLKVHIYESVPEYKDIGAGLALHMNAIKAMDLISPAVKKAYFDSAQVMATEADVEMSTQVMLAQGPDLGAVVAELGKAKGRKTVARSDLLAGLLKLIPKENISFGKRLESIKEEEDKSVQLTFKDGSVEKADCLIGADGVHSMTRSFLLGPDHPATPPQNHDGWQIYRTLVPVEKAKEVIDEKWTRTVPIMCGPRGHINCMPLHGGKDVSAGVAVRGAIKKDTVGTPDLRKDDFAEYSKDARDIVELVSRDPSHSWTLSDHDHAPFYARSQICMMGDAAHCAYPFAGNGAAQALEDAAVLTTLFAHLRRKSDISSALKAYDTVRRPRSQKVVEIARDFGRLYAFALEGVAGNVDAMRGFFKEKAAFTNNADLKAQNDEAVAAFEKLMEGGKEAARRMDEGAQGLKESIQVEKSEVAGGVPA